MTLRQQIKDMLNRENMTMTELVNQLNEKFPRSTGTPRSIQNMNNKIARESISFEELKNIAYILNHDISLRQLPRKQEFEHKTDGSAAY